jgi:hypothetical protein
MLEMTGGRGLLTPLQILISHLRSNHPQFIPKRIINIGKHLSNLYSGHIVGGHLAVKGFAVYGNQPFLAIFNQTSQVMYVFL